MCSQSVYWKWIDLMISSPWYHIFLYRWERKPEKLLHPFPIARLATVPQRSFQWFRESRIGEENLDCPSWSTGWSRRGWKKSLTRNHYFFIWFEEWLKIYSRYDSSSWGVKWQLPENLPCTKCNSQKIFGQNSARLRTWEVESACSHESSGTRKWNKGQIEKIGASLLAAQFSRESRKWKSKRKPENENWIFKEM